MILKLFLMIVTFKIIYIIAEYFYNINILNISSSTDFFNEKIMQNLNDNGHMISSVGFTLLLTPIFYLILNKIFNFNIDKIFKNFTILGLYILLPILIFFTSYFSLNKLVDYIVEKNIDKSYQAYYLNIFKIGLMNNYFKYDSFLNYENIKNNDLNTNDKIMFINTFLLLNADKDIIDKLKNLGKNQFLNIYIDQNKNDFYSKYNEYLKFDEMIVKSYDEFNSERISINSKINKNVNKLDINKEYNKINELLKKEYNNYTNKINKNKNILNNNDSLFDFINEINVYLSNRTKYESVYKKKIVDIFGKYIPVERFLDNNDKPNIIKLKNVISQELNINNILTFDDFKRIKTVNEKIYDSLKQKNLNPSKNVDYTVFKNFENLFIINSNSKIKQIKNDVDDALVKKIGKNDLTLDMDFNKFTNSNFIKNKIKELIKNLNLSEDYIKNVINVLNSKDKENAFKKEIYLNIIKKNNIVDKYLFDENDFYNDSEAKDLGIKSIKLLYIPIFALSISLISLLLNSVTVSTLVIGKVFNLNKFIVLMMNLIIISIIIYLPFINENNINNNLINMLSNNLDSNLDFYFKFLEFISYYENLIN